MDSARLNERIITGFAWQGASKIVVQTLSWVSTIVVARILNPADYGIMAVASVFVFMMTMIMEMGLSQGLIQKTATDRIEEDAVFYLSLLLGVFLYSALFLSAPYIARFYGMPLLETVLKVAGLTLVIGSLKSVPVALAMRRLDFRYRSLVEIGSTFVSLITVLSMAVYGFGVWSLVGGVLAHSVATAIGYLPSLRRFPRPTLRFGAIRDVVHYGLHVMSSNLAYVLSSKADVFIIGKVLGEKFTGYYALAFQLATIPLDKIGTVFNHVAFPAISRAKDNDQLSKTLFLDLHRYLLTISYPILLGIALVAEDAVVVLLTEKWLPIVPVLQVLCVINALRISGMLMTPVLNGRGKVAWTLRYSVAGMLVLPAAFAIGVQMGLVGVAYAWLIAYPMLYLFLLRYLMLDLRLRLRELLWSARSTVVASMAMAFAVMGFQTNGFALDRMSQLVLSASLGAFVYFAVFALFFRNELNGIWRALSMLRQRKMASSPQG